ncbi:MAG: nitrogenase component 1 [Clostridiales bacterium]|nr:nitrogenase component 1 [Clostridiales bacterium]
MSVIEERKALTREKRLSTLSHFNGSLDQLRGEIRGVQIKQRVRTFSQVSDDEIIYALRALGRIGQSAIVIHGALGCAASGIYYHQEQETHWYSTNLNERDTILGGDEKLRRAVICAYEEQNPKVIFIVGTPVVAINNDDVNSCILELEEELGVKILSIYTDGFKTKSPVTGYDIVLHALLRDIVEHDNSQTDDFINVVTLSENREDLAAVVKILKDLGISYQLFPRYSEIDGIRKAGRARATICLDADEGGYFAEGLEQLNGVPYIRTEPPIGIRGTRQFIRKLAQALSIEERASAYIEEQESMVRKKTQRSVFAGRSVFLDTKTSYVRNLTDFAESLGAKVSGIAITGVDLNNRVAIEKLDSLANATPVVIANGQPFEKANALSKDKVDFYISTAGDVAFAAQQGSIPVSFAESGILGYAGIVRFADQIVISEAGTGLAKILSKSHALYRNSWLKKSGNWYVKQEVR